MADLSPQEVQAAIRDLIRSAETLQARAAIAEDRVIAAMIRAQARTYEKIAELWADSPDFGSLTASARVRWHLENSAAIQRAIAESGYAEAVETYVDEYPRFGQIAGQILRAGRVPGEYTIVPKELVDYVKVQDRAFFSFLRDEAVDRLDKVFLDGIFSGVPKSTTLAELKGVITGSYKWGKKRGLYEWHAGTYARTAHHRATRTFLANQAQEAGIDEFVYIGPVDAKTRVFCRGIVGEVYTRQQIEQMDNGQTGLVMSDGGGWNCRHEWDPVDREMAAAIRGNQETVQEELAGAF